MQINSIEEIEWEEHIQEVTGWTESEVGEMIEGVCIEHGYHPDDNYQEGLERLVLDLNDNARDWMLPKYVKKFEKEIKVIEAWNKAH